MIATAHYGMKRPRKVRMAAFDELLIRDVLHIEDMGGHLCIIVGDDETRLHVTVGRRKGKTRVTLIEATGVRQ